MASVMKPVMKATSSANPFDFAMKAAQLTTGQNPLSFGAGQMEQPQMNPPMGGAAQPASIIQVLQKMWGQNG